MITASEHLNMITALRAVFKQKMSVCRTSRSLVELFFKCVVLSQQEVKLTADVSLILRTSKEDVGGC